MQIESSLRLEYRDKIRNVFYWYVAKFKIKWNNSRLPWWFDLNNTKEISSILVSMEIEDTNRSQIDNTRFL